MIYIYCWCYQRKQQILIIVIINNSFPNMLGFDFDGATAINRLNTHFEVISPIGSGGFSSVFRVRHKLDQSQYALKLVKIKPSAYKSDIFDYIQKVVGEAKILSALNHPNILRYHGCWIDGQIQDNIQSPKLSDKQEESFQMQMYFDQSQNSCGLVFESDSIQQKKSALSPKQNLEPKQESIFSSKLNKYKEIRVYILSELAETSLQRYISERNKNLSKNFNKITKQYQEGERNAQSEEGQQAERSMRIENYHFILDIIQALMYIHNQKIIHRDIKLQNIIIDSNKKCKIIDFGLAKRVRAMKSIQLDRWFSSEAKSIIEEDCEGSDDQEQTCFSTQKHSASVGTKIFSSPEQTSSDTYDHRTDIFSLGMAIALMFSYPTTIHEEASLLHEIRNKNFQQLIIDCKLKQVLQRCLSEPKLRPELLQIKKCIKHLLRQEIEASQDMIVGKNRTKNTKRQPFVEKFNVKTNSHSDKIHPECKTFHSC